MSGYIKLYRKVQDKGWYKDSHYVHLWVHLLMKANHKGAEFMHGGKIITLKSGQFVTGRKALSAETGIQESKIERILKLFEECGQIEQQTNSHNRVVTILSWSEYQESEQHVNNRRTTREQHVNTNKNDKNDKNDNKEKRETDFLNEVKTYTDLYPKEMLNAFFAYWSQWDRSGVKMRWEKEQTWETKKRLITWHNRQLSK